MRAFTIERVTIIQQRGFADLVLLHTDLPPAIYRSDHVTLEFKTAEGDGPGYLKNELRIEDGPNCPVEVITSKS